MFLIIFGIVVLVVLGFFVWDGMKNENGVIELPFLQSITIKPKVEPYSLVPKEISKSGYIAVKPPKNVSKEEIKKSVTFSPEIEGQWLADTDEDVVKFQPKALHVGEFYNAALKMAGGVINQVFVVKEDPKILAVFPQMDSEVFEESDVTIMFSRPMVALTTIDVKDDYEVPVTLEPKTNGKWRWITTRTLQFSPVETLIPATKYFVKVSDKFKSVDGVGIVADDYSFFTRKLRYGSLYEGQIAYNKPYELTFNQPVDLKKTEKEIMVRDTVSGKDIALVMEYGVTITEDGKTEENQSVINVYNKSSDLKRGKLWNPLSQYELIIKKAYPLKGTIALDEEKKIAFSTSDFLANTSAGSEKSDYVSADFLDPSGYLLLEFFEEIDVSNTKIEGEKFRNQEYEQKCKDETMAVTDEACEKIDDKTKLRVYISPKTERNFSSKLVIKDLINLKREKINIADIDVPFTTIPSFEVKKLLPTGDNNGLRNIKICSNNPVRSFDSKEYVDHIKANEPFRFFSFDESYKITNKEGECGENEFLTNINVGLSPLKEYTIDLTLDDSFGEQKKANYSFKTGEFNREDMIMYNLLDSYIVTAPDKTKITYAAQNFDYVEVNVCKTDPKNLLYYLDSGFLQYFDDQSKIKNCISVETKKIELENKYWYRNYFQIDLKDFYPDVLGHYIVTISNPSYKQRYQPFKQVYERSYVTVTNLSVVEKRVENWNCEDENDDYCTNLNDEQKKGIDNLYWVTEMKSLKPVEGADLELLHYNQEWISDNKFEITSLGNFKTDKEGISKTPVFANLGAVIIKNGTDSAIIANGKSKFERNSNAYSEKKYFIYSDRPIYRPGDTVHVKGIYRDGFDGKYEYPKDKELEVKLYNGSYEEIAIEKVKINDYGTFNIDFELKKDAPLGSYNVEVNDSGWYYFDVQEYQPAAFKVDIINSKEEYQSTDTVDMNVDAAYYFGAKVDVEEVEYSIVSQNYTFDRYKGDYYNFSDYSQDDYGYGDKFIMNKTIKPDSSGKINIKEKMDFAKYFKDEKSVQSKIFGVSVTVKNKSGQSITAQTSFIVHASDSYLGIKTDKYFVAKNEKIKAGVVSTDRDGKPKSLSGGKIVVNEVTWKFNKRQEVDGGYYNGWMREFKEVDTYSFSTGGDGLYDQEIQLAKEGEYVIFADKDIGGGKFIRSTSSVYVYGNGSVAVRNQNDTSLDIVVEKSSVDVGADSNIVIKSPYDKALALISFERGGIQNYEIVNVTGNLFKYDFKVLPSYYPNISATVTLLSANPDVKYGRSDFTVASTQKALNIETKTNLENYKPGDEVNMRFRVLDSAKKPVSSELSVAVVDMSVLALKGNPKKDPLDYFYSWFPLTVSTASNLKNILNEVDITDETKGGGGADENSANKKRGVFKDTAYWVSSFRTDDKGEGSIKFKLPDNLTTWQIETVAVTNNTDLGVSYAEFKTQKDVMVVPQKPRFIIAGDEFYLGGKIFNQTKKDQKYSLTLESSTLGIKDLKVKEGVLKAKEIKDEYFDVSAPFGILDGNHKFTLSLKTEAGNDVVEEEIPINRNETYESVATTGSSDKDKVQEYVYLPTNVSKDQGEVEIKTSATLAIFIKDGLEYLIDFPYDCSEQIASRLNGLLTYKKSQKYFDPEGKIFKDFMSNNTEEKYADVDEMIKKISTNLILERQNSDGGFGYYKGGQSNYYLSLYILETMLNLKDEGFYAETDALASYVDNYYKGNSVSIQDDNDLTIQTAKVLSRIKVLTKYDVLAGRLREILKDETFLKDGMRTSSLLALFTTMNQDKTLFTKQMQELIINTAKGRIIIDPRGAYLKTVGYLLYEYFESPIKNTAQVIKLLVKAEPESPIIESMMKWLMANQYKDGSWGSTNSTAYVIDAINSYMETSGEMESDFTLKTNLNGKEISANKYAGETLLMLNSKNVAIQDLKFEDLNTVEFAKSDDKGKGGKYYFDLILKYFLPVDIIGSMDQGFVITRNYYNEDDKKLDKAIIEAKLGDVVQGHIEIMNPEARHAVSIEEFIPAGMELVNFNLATENASLNADNSYVYDQTMLYPDVVEYRDDKLYLFKENLPSGKYKYDYYLRAIVPGTYHHLPAIVKEMYFPENFGRTEGKFFKVTN